MKPGFQLPPDAPAPRSCLIQKKDANEEYGYNLHAERGKGQFIGAVDDNSPASRAGLRPGDRIFAVNGRSIAGESHRSVVGRIKEDPLQCELLVLTEDGANWYEAHGISVSTDLPNIIHLRSEEDVPPPQFVAPAPPPTEAVPINGQMNPRPRLCNLEKQYPTDEFGFNLHAEKGRGHFVGAVDYEGIGYRAGLVLGQRIVGVNGELIYPDTPHKKVVSLIKQDPLNTELLVASEEVDRWYTEKKLPYSFEKAIIFRDPSNGRATRMVEKPPAKRSEILPEPNIPEEPSHPPPSEEPEPEAPPAQQHRAAEDEPVVAKTATLSPDEIMEQVFSSVSLADTKVKAHHNDTECVKGVHEIVVGAEGDAEQTAATSPSVAAEKTPEDSRSTTKSVSSQRSEKETVEVADVEDRPRLEPYFAPSPVQTPVMSAASKVASVTPMSRSAVNENNNTKFSLDSAKTADYEEPAMDIFKMSASEARARLMNRKKDIRKGADMTMDEKHRLIANM
uniref:PDZ domain-containing protein n=1 Tax=Steinernema glaseri TaxID=37863 RepID=A0A1I7ZSM2_9BILA